MRCLRTWRESGIPEPAELVANFYSSDHAIFEASDDSDGLTGDVFRLDAATGSRPARIPGWP